CAPTCWARTSPRSTTSRRCARSSRGRCPSRPCRWSGGTRCWSGSMGWGARRFCWWASRARERPRSPRGGASAKRRSARRRGGVVGPDPWGAELPLHPIRRLVTQVYELGEKPTAEAIDAAVKAHPEDRCGLLELFGHGGAASSLPLDVRRRECQAAVLGTV